jgi:predicted ATP-dependent serine protease
MSGEGKSHFAMLLGKYLADRFGDVLYISGEEGFAESFLQKLSDRKY